MKNPSLEFPIDRVTISRQGREAARKWQAGDTPFARILDDNAGNPGITEQAELQDEPADVEGVSAISERGLEGWRHLPRCLRKVSDADSRLLLDIGSRLEIAAPPRQGSLIVRSTTRVCLGDEPESYETRWEILPSD